MKTTPSLSPTEVIAAADQDPRGTRVWLLSLVHPARRSTLFREAGMVDEFVQEVLTLCLEQPLLRVTQLANSAAWTIQKSHGFRNGRLREVPDADPHELTRTAGAPLTMCDPECHTSASAFLAWAIVEGIVTPAQAEAIAAWLSEETPQGAYVAAARKLGREPDALRKQVHRGISSLRQGLTKFEETPVEVEGLLAAAA